ncbi:MAG: hypothetical protein SGPRY_004895 [Prymnesium sp.]
MGNAESQPVRNVDKRTARRDHAPIFSSALSRFRACRAEEPSLAAPPALPEARLRVCVRRRPMFAREEQEGEFDVLTTSARSICVSDCRMNADCRTLYVAHHSFGFDRVYDQNTPSAEVYQDAVAPLVAQSAQGRHTTVLMYGQTGSGKTFTMNAISSLAATDLFGCLQGEGDAVSMAYAELGPSGVRDMLNGGSPCQPLTDQAGDVQLVKSAQGLLSLLNFASSLRSTAATGVHDASSRSHAICRLYESAAINSSLMALKDCVRSLSRGDPWGLSGGRHVLTKLLKPAFTRDDAMTVRQE